MKVDLKSGVQPTQGVDHKGNILMDQIGQDRAITIDGKSEDITG